MQTQNSTNTKPRPADTDGVARVRFQDTRPIRRAMAAARTTMGNNDDNTRWGPSCRLIAHAGRDGIEVLATDDDDRAIRVRVDAERNHRNKPLDAPLKTDAVRAIKLTKSSVLTMEWDGETMRIIESNGTEKRFGAGNALQASAIQRVLDAPYTGPVAPEVPRTSALRALRAMPAQNGRICRMSISEQGLKAWASDCTLVGPNYPADALLAAGVARGESEIVFGIYRSMLTAALRTMTDKTVSLAVQAHDRPILLTSNDGRETVAISTKRLT